MTILSALSTGAGGAGKRRFDLGRVVRRTFGSIRRNLLLFGLLAVALAGPLLAVINWSITQLLAHALNASLIFYVQMLVVALLSSVLQAVIAQSVALDEKGEPADFRLRLSASRRSLVPVIGVSLVFAAGLVAGLLVTGVMAVLMPLFGVLMLPVYFVLVAIAASAWIVTVPVVVVERRRIFDAFGRSAKLTADHRWAIFALLVIYAILMVLGAVAGSRLEMLVGRAGAGAALGQFGLAPLVSALVELIGAVGVASIYFELRSIREIDRPEALASVFD